MTIQEAIKSGKRHKRPNHSTWYPRAEVRETYSNPQWSWVRTESYSLSVIGYDVNDVLADDWEVQEEKVTITREQFRSAWLNEFGVYGEGVNWAGHFESIAKGLGFK